MLYKRIDRSAGDMALGRMSTTRTHASPSAEPIRHLTCADIMTTIRGTQPAAAVIVHTVCAVLSMCPHSHSGCCSLAHSLSFPSHTISWLFLFFFLFSNLFELNGRWWPRTVFFLGGGVLMRSDRRRASKEPRIKDGREHIKKGGRKHSIQL